MTAKTTPPSGDAQKPWGGHPSCDPAPLTTSFGTVGQWERRHRAMVERTKGRRPKNRPCVTGGCLITPGLVTQRESKTTNGKHGRGGDPKTDHQKEELSKQLGFEGRGPENPGVVATLIFTSCRGNYWWDWTSTACGVLSRRHLEHFDNEFDLAGLKSFGCLEVDYVKPQKIVSSSPLVTV